jgi:tetratricopeptide (TPR) repeat protein
MDAEAQSLLRRASALRQAGHIEPAIAAYQAFVARVPQSPNSWYNLAWLQRRARRFEDAIASYARALEQGVADPEEVHLNRAVILADDLARPDEAEAELRAALALKPGYVPALLNLGNLHEDRGERPQAREAYARAVDAEPANATALARLAGVSSPTRADDPLVERLREALRHTAAPAERAELAFALGHALDAAAAYDEAFAAFAAANAAARVAAGPVARYDRAAQEAAIDRLIAAFPVPRPTAQQEGGEAPVFICGMFRSGSTLAEQILSAHGAVTAGGELDILPALVRERLQPYPQAIAAADAGALRDRYLGELRRIHPHGLITDKRPDNFLHIGLIKTLFPTARIVHTVRRPLDNILSVWFLHLSPEMSYAHDLEDIAHWYGQYRRLMAHWQALYPNDIFSLDYDALVADPRPHIAALLGFLGLPFEEACLSFHAAPGVVKTASVWQVRQPLYRRASGRWRNYTRHLEPLRAVLGED